VCELILKLGLIDQKASVRKLMFSSLLTAINYDANLREFTQIYQRSRYDYVEQEKYLKKSEIHDPNLDFS